MRRGDGRMTEPARCPWCGSIFKPRCGGTAQRFCRPACRRALDAAGRRWVEAAIASGALSMAELNRAAGEIPAQSNARVPTETIERLPRPDPLPRSNAAGPAPSAATRLASFAAPLARPAQKRPRKWARGRDSLCSMSNKRRLSHADRGFPRYALPRVPAAWAAARSTAELEKANPIA
jgi:hypothetical protein